MYPSLYEHMSDPKHAVQAMYEQTYVVFELIMTHQHGQ